MNLLNKSQWAFIKAVVATGVVAGLLAVFVVTQAGQGTDFYFEMQYRSSSDGYARLYYDRGKGFQDADSRQAWIDGKYRHGIFRIPVPAGRYRAFRLDLLDRECRMTITSARIVDKKYRVVKEFSPSSFAAIHQIASLVVGNKALDVATDAGADDPSLEIKLVEDVLLNPFPNYRFEFKCRSSVEGTARLYYDVGNGMRDEDSGLVRIKGGGTVATYRIPIPDGWYQRLRFDPLDREARMEFRDVCITGSSGRRIKEFDPYFFKAAQQISSLKVSRDVLEVVIDKGASDPILIVSLGRRFLLLAQWRAIAVRYALIFAVFMFVGMAFFLLGMYFLKRSGIKLPGAGKAVIYHAERHPLATIAFTSMLAVVLSCFPVVFYGKSFVSPNNKIDGIPLLYQAVPTVPGFDNTGIEDSRGSDLGAMMWVILPYSSVQYRSCMQYGEFPLWNRYDSCGSSLYAQVVSEFGDPLHSLVVAAHGASWAWDVKFVLAKALFAVGVGWLVYMLTGSMVWGALLGISAPFIGFFFFRYNHPAFFGLCYAPWIVVAWVGIVRARSMMHLSLCIAGLTLANWMEMHSGTAKEAYILLGCLNLWGWILLLATWSGLGAQRWKKVLATVSGLLLFVLMTAPTWVTFLDALGKAFTMYQTLAVSQMNPAVMIGVFDDIFISQLRAGEILTLPSANMFVLIGVIWAVASFPALWRNRYFLATAASALVPFALVFGIFPAALVIRIPFLANIYHVDNTFLCVLLVHLFVLAGFGLQACAKSGGRRAWRTEYLAAMGIFVLLLAVYFIGSRGSGKSLFFYADMVVLSIAVAGTPLVIRRLGRSSTRTWATIVVFMVLFAVIHWRHGMYVRTPFDAYVMNPQERTDISVISPSIRHLKTVMKSPARVVGQDCLFHPGYSGVVDLEGVGGGEALMNPFYRDLEAGMGIMSGWKISMYPEQLKDTGRFFDMINARYYLMSFGWKNTADSGLRRLASLDLDIYESPTAWPRAYFTGSVSEYEKVADYIRQLRSGDGRPFAAMQGDDWMALPKWLREARRGGGMVPATDYKLTNNTTSFRINAPGPGIVVLSECYLKGDFIARLDGRKVDYVRVNHAFKGVIIDRPGRHTVSFTYRPRYWNLTLWLSATAFAIFLAGLYFLSRLDRRRKTRG